jgi:hypothetical protein
VWSGAGSGAGPKLVESWGPICPCQHDVANLTLTDRRTRDGTHKRFAQVVRGRGAQPGEFWTRWGAPVWDPAQKDIIRGRLRRPRENEDPYDVYGVPHGQFPLCVVYRGDDEITEVCVAGTFEDYEWKHRYPLFYVSEFGIFFRVFWLDPGRYEYKFVVCRESADGTTSHRWECAPPKTCPDPCTGVFMNHDVTLPRPGTMVFNIIQNAKTEKAQVGFEHTAIVIDVHLDDGDRVRAYTLAESNGTILREFEEDKWWLYSLKDQPVSEDHAKFVVARATSATLNPSPTYGVIFSNCQHFTYWCYNFKSMATPFVGQSSHVNTLAFTALKFLQSMFQRDPQGVFLCGALVVRARHSIEHLYRGTNDRILYAGSLVDNSLGCCSHGAPQAASSAQSLRRTMSPPSCVIEDVRDLYFHTPTLRFFKSAPEWPGTLGSLFDDTFHFREQLNHELWDHIRTGLIQEFAPATWKPRWYKFLNFFGAPLWPDSDD